MIGAKKKEEETQVSEKLLDERNKWNNRGQIFTSFKPEYACGLGNFAVEGIDPADIQTALLNKYKSLHNCH